MCRNGLTTCQAGRQATGHKETTVLFDPFGIVSGILGFYSGLWDFVQQILGNLFGGILGG